MSAKLIDGVAVAKRILWKLKARSESVKEKRGTQPRLAIIASEDAASSSYLRAKLKACEEAGILAEVHSWPKNSGAGGALGLVARLAVKNRLDAIIIEAPLPEGSNAAELYSLIPRSRDVEGMSPINYGKFFTAKTRAEIEARDVTPPCTASAVLALLRESGAPLRGRDAVVIGRSEILGRPTAHYLTAMDATVTLCHSKTIGLKAHIKRADIVIACLGKPGFIKGAWLKKGAVVIDAGINVKGTHILGDVDFESAKKVASHISPVPGGVGPVTTAILLANTVAASETG